MTAYAATSGAPATWSAEAGGAAYWLGELEEGMGRENVLASFSESAENRVNVAGQTQDGILLDVDTFFTV